MNLITIIIASLCLASLARADPSTEQKRTCRIIFPERLNDSPKFAFLFDGKNSQQVQLPSMNFSPVITLPAGEITLIMSAKPVTDLKNLPADIPKLIIPADENDFYIYVLPDTENATLALKMKMITLNDGKFKPGETLWINETKHQISANLGLTKMTVAPEAQVVSTVPAEKSGYYRAELTFQPNGEGDFKKITEQQWWHDEKSRHLGFIVNNGDRLPKIFFFRDFR